MSAGQPVRASWLEALFDGEVAAAELKGNGDVAALQPEERTGQERWAPKRVSQYAAGRQCAHLAMAQLGVPVQPLVAQKDRRPSWPEGVVGSISHCNGFACAAVARQSVLRSVGVDAEVADVVDEALWPRIFTEEERAWIELQSSADRRSWATIFFSAKESFYKCQFPVQGKWLEFHDARVIPPSTFDAPTPFRLVVQSRNIRLEGHGCLRDGYVVTVFTWRS